MATLKKMKILLLGLAVILITFTVFVALPAQLPSLGSVSCKKLIWACGTSSGFNPLLYSTWMWDTPASPTIETFFDQSVKDTEDILDGLRHAGIGKLNIEVDPENEDRIIVSGYLQYGNYLKSENTTGIMASIPPIMMLGVMPQRIIQITLINYYEDDTVESRWFEVATDKNGFFSAEVEPDVGARCYTIIAVYEGEVHEPERPVVTYDPCDAVYTTLEFAFKEPGFPWWVWLIVGFAVITTGLLIYWYLKHRQKYIPEDTEPLPPAEEIEAPEVTEKKEGDEVGGDLLRIEIRFPQIKDPLPAVWGEGEAITVLVQLKDRNGKAIPSQPGDVNWGDGDAIQAISDKDGRIRLEHAFNIKREYIISVTCADESTGKELSSWRKIRIVDYREEMVRLFNEMVGTLNIRDIHIDRKMTAREIEKLLAPRLRGVPGRTIRRIVAGFEEANYSLHPIARKSYQAMYLAISEVLNYGG